MDYTKILPVLFLEYLAISLTKTLIPKLIVDSYDDYSYFVVGISETIKGILAFISCPILGRLSDQIGRKNCILVSMLGTTFPVCILSFTTNVTFYIICLSLSGLFSATFTLTFAYIADCVEKRKRAAAYGLALATFGLSFTIGPVMGGYINEQFGSNVVYFASVVLVTVNALYIVFSLPETKSTMVCICKTSFVRCEFTFVLCRK
jgi:DHA1 family tetracycline resistance protein-like MFS transporter